MKADGVIPVHGSFEVLREDQVQVSARAEQERRALLRGRDSELAVKLGHILGLLLVLGRWGNNGCRNRKCEIYAVRVGIRRLACIGINILECLRIGCLARASARISKRQSLIRRVAVRSCYRVARQLSFLLWSTDWIVRHRSDYIVLNRSLSTRRRSTRWSLDGSPERLSVVFGCSLTVMSDTGLPLSVIVIVV